MEWLTLLTRILYIISVLPSLYYREPLIVFGLGFFFFCAKVDSGVKDTIKSLHPPLASDLKFEQK